MRWGSLLVPVHLVSPSSQPHTPLSCRVPFHVFIFLPFLRAHMHVSQLLSFLGRPARRGGMCVCVCEILGVTGNPLIFSAPRI